MSGEVFPRRRSLSGEVFPRRRSCVETLRAPSFPLVTPPLGFPRYRAPEGALKGELGSLEAWRLRSLALLVGLRPTPRPFFFRKGDTRRETEGGGRGQRRSRRATDGARDVSRPQLRLCGPSLFPGRMEYRRERGGAWDAKNILSGYEPSNTPFGAKT